MSREELEARIARLEAALAARDRTIDVLVARCEGRLDGSVQTALRQQVALTRLVERKTAELQAQHAQLAVAHDELVRTQAQLLQAQKLEAIGRLAAGVAHEINTPVQYVSDSVQFVEDAMTDLGAVLAGHRDVTASVLAGVPDAATASAAQAVDDERDVDYALQQLPGALSRIQDGLRRVATIVRSMKEFSHPGTQAMAPADLNRAIAATLTIARNEYALIADVVTDFGDLPAVECHVGDVSQVVLNLLVNAAQAVGEVVAATGERGLITVRTRVDGPHALIEIADTGPGIPEAIRTRIFDPFFTTKIVGRGTGQGLALARSVVVTRHGGALTFETELGRGTTFVVRLPVAQAVPSPAGTAGAAA